MNILHGVKSLFHKSTSEEDNEKGLDQTRVYDAIAAEEKLESLDSPPQGSPAPNRDRSQSHDTMNTQKIGPYSGPIPSPELSDAEKHVGIGLQAAVPAPNEQTQPSSQVAPTHSAAEATSGEFQTPTLTSGTARNENKGACVVQPRRNPRREAVRGPAQNRDEVARQLQATPHVPPQKDAEHFDESRNRNFLHTSSTVSSDGSPVARYNDDSHCPTSSLLGPVNLPASMREKVAEANARLSTLPPFHRVTEPVSYGSLLGGGVNVVPPVPPGLNAGNRPTTPAAQQYGAPTPGPLPAFPPPFHHHTGRETTHATGFRNMFTATQPMHAAIQPTPFLDINSVQGQNYLQQYQGAQPPHPSYFQFATNPLQGAQRSGVLSGGQPRNFMQGPQMPQAQYTVNDSAHVGWPATNQPWGHQVTMMDVAPRYGVASRNLPMRPLYQWMGSQNGQYFPRQMIHTAAAQPVFMPNQGPPAPVVDNQGGHVESH